MAHRTVSERNLGKKTLKKFACLGIDHEFLSSADIFITNFSLFFFLNIPSGGTPECQTAWIQNLGPNCWQRSSADDKISRKQAKC